MNQNTRSVADRFWAKVDRGRADDCWEWTASLDGKGYGQFFPKTDASVRAHRWSFADTYGPIPDTLCVCHKCDNPKCVNPNHLFLGTHADNMRDMRRKGRHPGPGFAGESHPNVKLTDSQVREIRAGYSGAWGEQTRLAQEYGVHKTLISTIVRGNHR